VLIELRFTAPVRLNIRDQQKAYDQSEEDLKAIQSVGQIIGEVLKQLDDERCELGHLNMV
jgi:ATP-dependent 26S proteasome regulatory subunit